MFLREDRRRPKLQHNHLWCLGDVGEWAEGLEESMSVEIPFPRCRENYHEVRDARPG